MSKTVRGCYIVDPDFQSEENENEKTTNEEELPNTMGQDPSSRQYIEGVRVEIANSIWARIR